MTGIARWRIEAATTIARREWGDSDAATAFAQAVEHVSTLGGPDAGGSMENGENALRWWLNELRERLDWTGKEARP